MHDLKALQSQNKDWYEEHTEWMEETLRWQRETKRLVAILYQLERALPEHSLTLTRHVAMIKEHQRLLLKYESGLDEECYPQCPGFDSATELENLHQSLCETHDKTDLNHRRLRKNYMAEMKHFKALAQKLMGQTD